MNENKFNALIVEKKEGEFIRHIGKKSIDELPAGDILINVKYSSLNYKDALSATGNPGVTRRFPHTPGIDAAGVVAESSGRKFKEGDEVLVTGYDLGMNTSGGFGQYIRVPAEWVVKLPEHMSLRESMQFGTAGFTAALAVYRLQKYGLQPWQGEVLVTGASGGVGSLAISILVKEDFRVVAATGKSDAAGYLKKLGARSILSREEVTGMANKALLQRKWVGAVDTVGGEYLASALKATDFWGAVASCGNAASSKLELNVYPFILRGVSLLGVDSGNCPMDIREEIWQKLAREWKLEQIEDICTECGLEELDENIGRILKGGIRGRILLNLEM